jgi:hypothetical protein
MIIACVLLMAIAFEIRTREGKKNEIPVMSKDKKITLIKANLRIRMIKV